MGKNSGTIRHTITGAALAPMLAGRGGAHPGYGRSRHAAFGRSELNGPVLSRGIVLNEGAFTFSGRLSDGGEIGFVNSFIDSGIRMGRADVRRVAKIADCARNCRELGIISVALQHFRPDPSAERKTAPLPFCLRSTSPNGARPVHRSHRRPKRSGQCHSG